VNSMPTEDVIMAMGFCLMRKPNKITREEIITAWRIAQPKVDAPKLYAQCNRHAGTPWPQSRITVTLTAASVHQTVCPNCEQDKPQPGETMSDAKDSATLSISGAVVLDLKKYLLAHEDDIYYGINDFGNLAHVFHVIMERQAMQMRSFAAERKE